MKIYFNTFLKHCSKDNDNFPYGIRLYDGLMGAGKSLSMVFDLQQLEKDFPDDFYIFSNMTLKSFINVSYYHTVDELIYLINHNNNRHTVILMDEALSYFAENGGIDPALMSIITLSRKKRIFIMIGCQIFKRLNNRIRDFSLETVKCRSILNFQINTVRDDQTTKWDKEELDFVGKKKFTYVFKRNDVLFDSYDTFEDIKIEKGQTFNHLLTEKQPPPTTVVSPNKSIFKRKVKL